MGKVAPENEDELDTPVAPDVRETGGEAEGVESRLLFWSRGVDKRTGTGGDIVLSTGPGLLSRFICIEEPLDGWFDTRM
jgi:hypothetical protein